MSACHTYKPIYGPSSTDLSQQQRNLAADADNVVLRVFETVDVAKLDAVIDPAFVNHIGLQDRGGLDNLKTMI